MISLGSKKVDTWVKESTWEDDNTGQQLLDLEELKETQEVIVISMALYESLERDSDFLNALRAAGVDNWEGYGFAQDIMEGEDE